MLHFDYSLFVWSSTAKLQICAFAFTANAIVFTTRSMSLVHTFPQNKHILSLYAFFFGRNLTLKFIFSSPCRWYKNANTHPENSFPASSFSILGAARRVCGPST